MKVNLRIFFSFIILFILTCLICNPARYSKSIYDGFLLFFQVVMPCLFPFFFLTGILCELNIIDKLTAVFKKPLGKVFHLPDIASYVFLMSIISGYPVGAKLISEFYKKNLVSQNEAHRMTVLCSTSGMIFIFGTLVGNFGLPVLCGVIIYISHIMSSLFNAAIFRNFRYEKQKKLPNNFDAKLIQEQLNSKALVTENKNRTKNILSDTAYSSILSLMTVGAFIALFYMFVDIIIDLNLFAFTRNIITKFLSIFNSNSNFSFGFTIGLFELTRGCNLVLAPVLDLPLTTVICTALISFGGMSINLQSMAFLSQCGIKTSFLLLTKSSQMLISIIMSLILSLIFL